MRKILKREQTWDEILFDIFLIIMTVVLLIVFIYPLYYLVICSFSEVDAVFNGEVKFLPVGFSLESYKLLLARDDIWQGYLMSASIVLTGTIINLFFTLLGAYVCACPEFLPRNVLMKVMTFTMFFSGGLIPEFMLIKNLGLYDTYWALILPGAINVTNLIIARTFFMNSIPNELREAAILDGCSHTRMLISVVLPLSKAIIAVMALYYGVSHWNSYFNAMIYLGDDSIAPLQLVLRQILLAASSTGEDTGADIKTILRQVRLAEQLKYSSVVVASLPALIAYPFVQKYFVKGVMIGSVKG